MSSRTSNYDPILCDRNHSECDLDHDILMFMLGEGDVPPDTPGAGSSTGAWGVVVDQISTGCETTKRKTEDVAKGHAEKGLLNRAEAEVIME